MLKHYLLLFIFCFTTLMTFGQVNVKGRVFEVKTRITLADIQVQNLTTHQITRSDEKGRFSITAKTGDLLVFNGFAYNADTLLVANMHEQEVFLVPHQNFLDEVKVTTDSTKKLNTYDPEFHGQTMIYQRDPKTGYYKGGVILRLWWWKKDEHKRERLEKKLKEQREQDEVNKVFTPATVGKYVPLKGRDMDDFILLYTPDIKVYYHNDFNLAAYLNDCYAKYLKLPEHKRHPQKLEPQPTQ